MKVNLTQQVVFEVDAVSFVDAQQKVYNLLDKEIAKGVILRRPKPSREQPAGLDPRGVKAIRNHRQRDKDET